MLNIKTLLFIIGLISTGYTQFDINVQKKWDRDVLVSGGYIKKLRSPRHYILAGTNVRPAKIENMAVMESKIESNYTFHSYYGLYTGYYITVLPIFRPGIHFGIGYKKSTRYSRAKSDSGFRKDGYSDWEASPYFGIGIHAGILSFIISNEGIGGGLNIIFGRRGIQ